MDLTDGQIDAWRQRARDLWEANTRSFEALIREQINQLSDRPAPPIVVDEPVTAPITSRLSDLPPMYYVGRVNCVTGQGDAARHQIHILRQHGLRLRVIDAGSCADPDPDHRDDFIQSARASDACTPTGGTIIHLQPNTAEPYRP